MNPKIIAIRCAAFWISLLTGAMMHAFTPTILATIFVVVPQFKNCDGDVDFYLKATADLILKADCSWRPWVIL